MASRTTSRGAAFFDLDRTLLAGASGEVFSAAMRTAGRPIVLATTTPYDLVKPLADLLGLDDVVATRYRLAADGTYDGALDGPFVWSTGKLAAVKEWAARNAVDLAESF